MEPITITNRHVCHIAIGHGKELTCHEIVKHIIAINPDLFKSNPQDNVVDYKKISVHINEKVLKPYVKIRKMNNNKQKQDTFEKFYSLPYIPPIPRKILQSQSSQVFTPRKRKLQHSVTQKTTELKRVKLKCGDLQSKLRETEQKICEKEASEEQLSVQCRQFEEELVKTDDLNKELEQIQFSAFVQRDDLKIEVDVLRKKCVAQSLKLKTAAGKLRVNSKGMSKLNEKLQRRDAQIDIVKKVTKDQTSLITAKEKEITSLKSENKSLNITVEKERNKKYKLRKLLTYYRDKSNDVIRSAIKDKNSEISSLMTKISLLTKEKDELQSLLDLTETPIVKTFEDGKYVDPIREVYIKLLCMNVGRDRVAEVINTVLLNLTNITLEGPLPSAALTSVLFAEARQLANLQAAITLSENPNSTLHYDETTKYGFKYGSIQLSAGGRSYAVGLFDEDKGTSERLFESIKECLVKTAQNLSKVSGVDELSKLLFNIKNTMTDRHRVNYGVDKLLEDWRNEIAKLTIEGFESLPEGDRKKCIALNKLRCNLHFLLGLANAAENALIEFDSVVHSTPIESNVRMMKATESGTTRTIRTVCKAFQKHGSEQAGVMAPFAIYLKESPVKLASFSGNRFNIVFWNAACVIFHLQNFHNFFSLYGAPNRLLKAVMEDLNEVANIAGCRALGIVDKLVTGPYWRKCESVANILDLNPIAEEMQANCLLWSEDATTLLLEKKPAFASADVQKDTVFEALFAMGNDELDQLTLIALELIMGHFCIAITCQLKDMLEGGILHQPSDELREETVSCPTTNLVSERVFGSYDRYLRRKPNATTLNLESTILFETNKTSVWLKGMDEGTKKLYMEMARKSAKIVIRDFHQRRDSIKERIRENLVEKQRKEEVRKNERISKTRKIIADVQRFGGEWVGKEDAEEKLAGLTDDSERQIAVLSQLQYHKFVVKSKCDDKKRFQKTVSKRPFSLPQLINNLFFIINFDNTSGSSLTDKQVKSLSTEEMKKKLQTVKLNISKRLKEGKRKAVASGKEEQKEETKAVKKSKIKKITPNELVGKNVEHIFNNEEDANMLLTYKGVVTKVVKRKPNVLNTIFEIVYDYQAHENDDSSDDEDREPDEQDTFEYELLRDYYKGDLVILE